MDKEKRKNIKIFVVLLAVLIFLSFAALSFGTAPQLTVSSPENISYNDTEVWLNASTDILSNVTYSLNSAENVTLFENATSGNQTITAEFGNNNIVVYGINISNSSELDSKIIYFSILAPDYEVSNLVWTSDDELLPKNTSSVYVNVTAENIGTLDGNVNVGFYWDEEKIDETSVALNVGNSTVLNFTKEAPLASGWHNISIFADFDDVIEELNESNNEVYNDTLYVGLIIDVYYLQPSLLKPGENTTIKTRIEYFDNSTVQLNYTNFIIEDLTFTSTTYNITNFNEIDGNQSFNISTPTVQNGEAQQGIHTIKVCVFIGNYSGCNISAYNLTAPKVRIEIIDLNLSKEEDEFDIYVHNEGDMPLSSLNVSFITTNATVTPSSCQLGNLAAGTSNTTGCVNLLMERDSGLIVIKAIANGTWDGDYFWDTDSDQETITGIVDGDNGDDDDDENGDEEDETTRRQPAPECTEDSDCDSGEECSSGDCVELDCGDDEKIVNHMCIAKGASIRIRNYPSSIELETGRLYEINVTANNNGEQRLTNFDLGITGVNWTAEWYNVSFDNTTLESGESTVVHINMTVPNNASVSNYSIILNLYSNKAEDSRNVELSIIAPVGFDLPLIATIIGIGLVSCAGLFFLNKIRPLKLPDIHAKPLPGVKIALKKLIEKLKNLRRKKDEEFYVRFE